ncbi:ERF family protein [Bartonella bacilliformis]|uniref:ERF family protein n=1 Tax=Bartonella bacilliformis TaxID=774 RepID=UPI00049FB565|nr:ERF family protein [Bartonella bacilliformis]KEG17115.1 hypothetical protein H705_01009 [Bartonella bacilliformis Cond044]
MDMNRLEHLIALREKEIDRQCYEKFVSDLSAMQSECKEIIKNATNNFTNSKYATLDYYIDGVKEALAKHRFALFSKIKSQTTTNIVIEMTLAHPSGHKVSTDGEFPINGAGSKISIQSIGSTITYARRYLLGMLLNVASRDDDLDGNSLETVMPASPQQVTEIKQLIKTTHANEIRMLAFVKANSIAEMSDYQAQMALNSLKDRQRIQSFPTPQ